MKLLFILPEYLPDAGGGIITYYRAWLPRLVAMGHQVRVIVGSASVSSDDAAPVLIDGVSVERLQRSAFSAWHAKLPQYAALPGLRGHLAAAWAMWEQADGGRGYDAVEACDWGLLFVPWVVEQRAPVVVQMHGSVGQIDLRDPVDGEELQGHMIRLIEKHAVACAQTGQSPGAANAAFWQAQTARAVDAALPAYAVAPASSSAASRSSRGLVVGRVQRWKGPQVLCHALRLLGQQAPNVDWVGRDTSYGARNKSTSAFLAQSFPEIWNTRLMHCESRSAADTATAQAGAAFVLVPSTWDVFNFTCVEAMAVATPVLCSRGAGASKLIEHGVNGLLFDADDAHALADVLRSFAAMSAAERTALGERGRQTIIDAMHPDHIASQRLQAFADAATRPRQALPAADWFRLAVSSAAVGGAPATTSSFLDHLPLKELSRYVLRRSLKKVIER